MAFCRTYLSHRPRHEELAEHNMQCNYSCCVAASVGGIERRRWRRAPAPGCPHPTRVCTAATLPRTNAMRCARCTKLIDTIFIWKKNYKKNTRLLVWYAKEYNVDIVTSSYRAKTSVLRSRILGVGINNNFSFCE